MIGCVACIQVWVSERLQWWCESHDTTPPWVSTPLLSCPSPFPTDFPMDIEAISPFSCGKMGPGDTHSPRFESTFAVGDTHGAERQQ